MPLGLKRVLVWRHYCLLSFQVARCPLGRSLYISMEPVEVTVDSRYLLTAWLVSQVWLLSASVCSFISLYYGTCYCPPYYGLQPGHCLFASRRRCSALFKDHLGWTTIETTLFGPILCWLFLWIFVAFFAWVYLYSSSSRPLLPKLCWRYLTNKVVDMAVH